MNSSVETADSFGSGGRLPSAAPVAASCYFCVDAHEGTVIVAA
jgi:hypothetical protein